MSAMDFSQQYQRQVFLDFLRQQFLPEDFSVSEEEMDLEFAVHHIDSVIHLGQCPDLNLNVYEIHHQSEHDPRVTLTKETFRLMKSYRDFNALAVFVSGNSQNYRLSYVTMGLKEEGDQIAYEQSNPRRYSYFLGPDAKINTPTRFLANRGRVTDMDDLRGRFSVEVVNKEFYREIATLFTELVGGNRIEAGKEKEFEGILRLPSVADRRKMQEFAVRMIGRVVFCWFLKKKNTSGDKPLIPEPILSLEAVKKNANYYHTILEKLFFQVLNTQQDKRWEEFNAGSFSNIPFLNGGLFEPHNDDIYELNEYSGTSKFDNTLVVPDEWFEKLLELLERYNFTIDENTSMDVELSVDPEMLGRIFENLLAEINPETGETARKSTGSYYTPRPIVEYMVDESLIQYLFGKTGISTKKLRCLLSFSEDVEDLNRDEARKIIDALDVVKIIDPACGSGAFPMGILQKMVLVLQKADPEMQIWKNKQLEGISSSYVRNAVEEQMKNEDWNYIRKMGIIQDAIYGVDIQQIAVEISKLRVFLSLIVDTKVLDDKPNKGIEPLPNLEFKFVCANTLVGLTSTTSSVFDLPKEVGRLKSLKGQYFSSSGTEKQRIEREYNEVRYNMFGHALSMTSMGEKTLALSKWDPFSDEAAEWFDPEWMFDIKNGFDIVIANPPYVRQEAIRALKSQLKKYFGDFYCGTADLYTYFYKSGLDMLRQAGHLCFIAPNKFMRAGYGKNTRILLTSEATPRMVIDFGELPVFDAGTDPSIILVEKRKSSDKKNEDLTAAVIKKKEEIVRLAIILDERGFKLKVSSLEPSGWTLEKSEVLNLIKKMRNVGRPLGEYIRRRFYRGVLTGFNNAFVIDGVIREKLMLEDPRSAELIKPWLRGRDIRKWKAEWARIYIIAIPSSGNREWPWSKESNEENACKIFAKSYPAVHRHLAQWESGLKKRDDQGKFWWELRSCSYYNEFEGPKIVYADIAKLMRASYDTTGAFCANTLYIIPTNDLSLLGILHSRLFDWYSRQNFQSLGDPWRGGRLRFIAQYMEKFPIPVLTDEQRASIAKYVRKIIKAPDTPGVERLEVEIDRTVYQLYNLTPLEIEIIENQIDGKELK